MTLAARLLFAFALVAIGTTGLVGWRVREATRDVVERGFRSRIEAAHESARVQLAWEVETLRGLLVPLCEHDTFLDRTLVGLEAVRGDVDSLDADRRIALRYQVPDQAKALKLDELYLVTGSGVVLGAGDVGRIGTRDVRLASLVKAPPGARPRFRPASAGGGASIEVHCARTSNGVTLGLVGARRVSGILERAGAQGVKLNVVDPAQPAPASDAAVERHVLEVPEVEGLRVVAAVSREELRRALRALDTAIAMTGAMALLIASAIAVVLARSLSRPIVALARETREVVSGEPRKVYGRGGREIAELASSFNRTIDELTAMRRRLAVTERIAARREVARQIAHEIKNPLAPIRAAVETLRRLRARDDPAFDEYFEEATSTVLGEVHRIANIVTEFTRFARLPPPKPERIDLVAVARGVVTLHGSPDAVMGAGIAAGPSGSGAASGRGAAGESGSGGEAASGSGGGSASESGGASAHAGSKSGAAGGSGGGAAGGAGGAGAGLGAGSAESRPSVELVTRGAIPLVMADKDQMVQVLTNLVQNGLEAAGAVRRDPRVEVAIAPLSDDRVRIVVTDNGPGVSDAMLPKLFEPYATTKEKGTGLGLAIVQRIVFEHGGEIVHRRGDSAGAIFEITLPVSGPPLLEKPPAGEGY